MNDRIRLGKIIGSMERLDNRYGDPEERRRFNLLMKDLEDSHTLIVGPTGAGKSRLIRHLARSLWLSGWGVAVIDKHSHTAEDIAADVASLVVRTGRKQILKNAHFVEFTPQRVPRLDFARFDDRGLHPEIVASARAAWSVANADRNSGALQRGAMGDSNLAGYPRLVRMLRNVFIAGTVTCQSGEHLCGALLRVLLEFTNPHNKTVLSKVLPLCPEEVRNDILFIRSMKREQDMMAQVEGPLNRLRGFFSPLVAAAFSSDGTDEVLDFAKVTQGGHLLLVALGETPYFSHQQGVTVGGYFVRSLVEALVMTPRTKIRPFAIFLEECGELLSPDEIRYLGAIRKYGGKLFICGQGSLTFRTPTFDAWPQLLTQCLTKLIVGPQLWPEDNEVLARILYGDQVEYKPLKHRQQRQTGEYDWLKVPEISRSFNRTDTRGRSDSVNQTQTTNKQISKGGAEQKNWSDSDTWQSSSARSNGVNVSLSNTHNRGQSESPVVVNGKRADTLFVNNTSSSSTQGTAASETNTTGSTFGGSSMKGGSKSASWNEAQGSADAKGLAHSDSQSSSQGEAISISEKWVHLPVLEETEELSGQLERAESDQLGKFRQKIQTNPKQHTIVKIGTQRAVQIENVNVPDAFVSMEAQERALKLLRRELDAIHGYSIALPDLTPAEEERQLRRFLEKDERTSSCAKNPVIVAAQENLLA